MFDYAQFKRDTLEAAKHIGLYCSGPLRVEWLTPDQKQRIRAKNFVTDEKWQFRLLADRSILVEISYGWFIDHPVLGLTVFHKGESAALDHERSKACHSITELTEALETLHAGRLAALEA